MPLRRRGEDDAAKPQQVCYMVLWFPMVKKIDRILLLDPLLGTFLFAEQFRPSLSLSSMKKPKPLSSTLSEESCGARKAFGGAFGSV